MTEKNQPLDFDEVCDLLVNLSVQLPASEVHGLLVGELAAGKRMDVQQWQQEAKQLLDIESNLNKEQLEQMQYFYMATLSSLGDEQLGFYPLLLDDDAEIELRLQTLASWCQGFLAGFALVEKQVTELSEVVNDALNDLAAISQVAPGIDDEQELDSAEQDYFQIVEYVRLAAMNIFIEYAVDSQAATREGNDYLSNETLFNARKLH